MGKPNSNGQIPCKLSSVIFELFTALEYAMDTDSSVWDFAISIERLIKLGANEADLRWLVKKGYVEHRIEVTLRGNDGREFRSIGNLTFTRKTCFILTESGTIAVNPHQETECSGSLHNKPGLLGQNGMEAGINLAKPAWDANLRKLVFEGLLVKRFKWPAPNQEIVLSAFQEEGWPERIDDPLSPDNVDQDPKRKLADTIKCLNQKQFNQLIRFHGDGRGEGILWEGNANDLRNTNGKSLIQS